MKIKLKKYTEQILKWPKDGHHIMAQYDHEKIIVYQSYRNEIGHFAAENQFFGGAFSLDRMTWIKPNFLWMMYRNGWGTKEGQEVVLAIHLKLEAFERYLKNAVYSSFNQVEGITQEAWKDAVKSSNVRLQWDPDHDPYGDKLDRRAIQIGLRNEYIRTFSKEDVLLIEDISQFVAEQYEFVKSKDLDKLLIPEEKPFYFSDEELNRKLKISK
ncbi:DUF4291 domain-containing protein [Flavobacterium sp. NRK F7]|uniref:DUF4291 domain-containing protein n=1 Tax=Flavobacterium sp. NRK F7 TaxID=2954930 RepID=UPI00209105A6|nr:DUF4291 domain-containing protein [Flavobacterium sp. NRK F7]MCO6161606.1 DUF4291 domain-containing protein [Flavobacterium sp. NRK F7]